MAPLQPRVYRHSRRLVGCWLLVIRVVVGCSDEMHTSRKARRCMLLVRELDVPIMCITDRTILTVHEDQKSVLHQEPRGCLGNEIER